MTLKEHINDIRKGLETNHYPDEAAVSQGIVLRLLGALGWTTFDIQVVVPQYGVEARKVDYALCDPPSKPLVFIEVKRVGNIEGAERQLFEYAFHEGIPIAVLTDGREWQFFHPTAQGDYRERKVYELNLGEGNSEEIAKCLGRYLNYASIGTGEAVENIKQDYEKVIQQRQVATHLPEAWGKLLEEADEFLVHAVAEKTESLCGHKPTDEQVLDFLKGLKRETESNQREISAPPISNSVSPSVNKKPRAPQTRLRVTMATGEVIDHHKATESWIAVILRLGPDLVMNVDKEELLVSTTKKFRQHMKHGKYYISTDYSTKVKKERLDRIASRLGVQLKVEIIEK